MIHRILTLGRWDIDFLFAKEGYDEAAVVYCLLDASAPDKIIDKAEELMGSCEYNCGFTYINSNIRRAVVLIGPTTSGQQFVNTFVHEIHHLAVAIASDLGVDLEGESPAYLAGDAAMDLAEAICELGCRHCH